MLVLVAIAEGNIYTVLYKNFIKNAYNYSTEWI